MFSVSSGLHFQLFCLFVFKQIWVLLDLIKVSYWFEAHTYLCCFIFTAGLVKGKLLFEHVQPDDHNLGCRWVYSECDLIINIVSAFIPGGFVMDTSISRTGKSSFDQHRLFSIVSSRVILVIHSDTQTPTTVRDATPDSQINLLTEPIEAGSLLKYISLRPGVTKVLSEEYLPYYASIG